MRRCLYSERSKDGCILHFLREELLYDISNYCFVEGDIISKVESEHDRHQVIDVAEDGNVDRVTRVMDLAFSESVEMLYPYTKRQIEQGCEHDDVLKESEEYVIEMVLPQGFSETTIDYVGKLIHEYIVARVVGDWLSITKPNAAANWAEKAEDARTKIKSGLLCRLRGVRRRMHPF